MKISEVTRANESRHWLIRHCFFMVRAYEEPSCVTIEFGHKIWGAVSVMMEGLFRVGQSSGWAIRFRDVSPATMGYFGRFRIDLSCTPQILKALWLNFGNPMSNRDPDKGDCHSFPIEMMYAYQNHRMLDFSQLSWIHLRTKSCPLRQHGIDDTDQLMSSG